MSLMPDFVETAERAALPGWWVKPLAIALALIAFGAGMYGLGRVHEARLGAAALNEYKSKQVAQVVTVVQHEVQVVTKTETVYRDRIHNVYTQGAEIEAHIPQYIQPTDDASFGVNTGFLRTLAAAWAGTAAGPAAESDREPAGVPLSAVAGVEVHNATSCLAWRVQALGWREFYAGQQRALNGKAGDWYNPESKDLQDTRSLTAAPAALTGEAK